MNQFTEKTRSSYPYVTGMGLRNKSHMIFDEFQLDDASKITQDNQVVFVKTDMVPYFFASVMPNIRYKVNIITHNSALGIDHRYTPYLEHPQILRWYAQNANYFHTKLESLPLGIANRRWPHGDIEAIEEIKSIAEDKKYLVYMNFDINTNVNKRTKVFNFFNNKEFVLQTSKKPFKGYLEDLSLSKYCISPPGAGIDCHRIWESIAVGTIPIVERCNNISFHAEMPIMIIDSWSEVTKEMLEHKYDFYKSGLYKTSRLYMDYWVKKIGLIEQNTEHKQ